MNHLRNLPTPHKIGLLLSLIALAMCSTIRLAPIGIVILIGLGLWGLYVILEDKFGRRY